MRTRLTSAATKATIPVFFLQAENDYDLTPNRVLSEEVRKAGKSAEAENLPHFRFHCARWSQFLLAWHEYLGARCSQIY